MATVSTTTGGVTTDFPLNNGSSSSSNDRPLFHWADYLVFGISLGIPLVVGVFFMFYKRKEATTESFLTGERNMNFVVVAMSLLASLLNGAFVIGVPAEIHYYGIAYSYLTFGVLVSLVTCAQVFVPKYNRMTLTSAYEYVEKRFNKPTRLFASAVFILSVVVFLAIVLYVPALSFSQVTTLSLYTTIVITGVICTVYTAIGGIKAVVWTDAIQMVILLVGLILIAILGAKEVGGGQRVWDIAMANHRINFNEFSPDPRARVTFWTQLFGQGMVFLGIFVSNQMMVQRYMGVATAVKAQLSLYIVFLFFLPLVILIVFIGLVVHASYAHCDPLFTKQIDTPDQIFPLYVMDLLGKYHGIPGLITASIFAAALSSVSAVINSLSAVVLGDYIDPIVFKIRKKPMTDSARRAIAVSIVVFFGALTVALSFVADKLTDKLIQATGTIWGVLGGPLAGIFLLGFLFPCANAWGANIGMLVGLVISLWVAIGNIIYGKKTDTLPIFDCVHNVTLILPLKTPNTTDDRVSLQDLYEVSFAWYGVIGTGACMIVGLFVSMVTGGCSQRQRSSVDVNMLYSCADNCCCCCPSSCIRCYRCGVDYDSAEPIVTLSSGTDPETKFNEKMNGEKAVQNGYDVEVNDSFYYIQADEKKGVFRRHSPDGVTTTTTAPPFDENANGHANFGYMTDIRL